MKTMPEIEVLDRVPEIRVPPGKLGAILELIVRDKSGRVTEHQMMRSESFVKQFLQALWMHMTYMPNSGSAPINYVKAFKDTDGNNFYSDCKSDDWRTNAGVGATGYGILVGTGATAPTINDFKIEALIAHGVGAGQLQYSAVTFGAPAADASTSQFTITRDFANGSGGSITVREIGLAVQLKDLSSTPAAHYILTIRDAVNITIPTGQTLTVNYRIQAVV